VPAVSVIMPAWNAEAYLGAAIDSVLGQTMCDLELLVVDDGSKDGTRAVAEACQRRDSRVRLLLQENGGPSAARNRAMNEARGAWFAFVDSDDLWAPSFLESQLAVFAAHPDTDLVTGNARYLGGPFGGRPVRPSGGGPEPLSLLDLIEGEAAVFIMTVFRRAVFDTIGGLDEGLLTSEDYEFWIRAARAGIRYRRNPAPLGWYRQRTGSLSASEVRMLRGILRAYQLIRPQLAVGTPERAALERQVRRFSLELVAAESRVALEAGDAAGAAERLERLHQLRGGLRLRAAATLLRIAPRTAVRAYRLRDRLRRVRTPRPADSTVLTPASGEAH